MGNERDYDGEYQRDRESESEFDDGWDSLASEGKVYEFTKLTPIPSNYYQKQQVTNYSLSLMEQYQGTEKPQFDYSTEQTNSPTQNNKQGNKPGNRQKPQQSKKQGFFSRMFGGNRDNQQQNQKQSGRNDRGNVNNRTPRSPNQGKSKDTSAVADFQQRLRKQGKANLDQNQQNVALIREAYTNPEKLAQSKPKLDDLRLQTRKAGEIKAERKRLERELVLQGGTELTAGEAGMGGGIRHNPQRKAEIESQLEQVRELEDAFLAEYPLASLLNTQQVDDSVSDRQLQETLAGRLGQVNQSIEETKARLDNGDLPIEELDGLKPQVLANTPEHERAEVEKYLRGQKRKDTAIKTATTVGSLGLGIGALVAAPYSGGSTLPYALGTLGSILGFGGAAYNFERAADLNQAAKTSDAGGNQLLNDPEQAKQDYAFAWVDLGLGLIDGGLAIREGGKVLKGAKAAKKILSNGGADAIAKLTPEQTRKFQTLATSTDDVQKQQLRQSLRQELGDDFDAANKVFDDSNLETISDAEAAKITGRGPDEENIITNKFPDEKLDSSGKIVGEVKVVNGKAILTNGKPVPRQTSNFVITRDKRLIIGRKHTTLSNNEDVLAAGNIVFKGGKVRMIDNLSGHFRPTVEEGLVIPKLLKNQGFDVSGANLKLYEFVIDSDGMVDGRSLIVNEYLK